MNNYSTYSTCTCRGVAKKKFLEKLKKIKKKIFKKPGKKLKIKKFCHKWQHLWLLVHPIKFYKNSIFGRFNEHMLLIKVVFAMPLCTCMWHTSNDDTVHTYTSSRIPLFSYLAGDSFSIV